jgi:CMP-N-acetylneuraminic acid synthetase
VHNIDEKYIFCSDDSIRDYIPKGLIFLKREKWLDSFEVKGLQIIENFISLVDADIYVLTHVTSPFLKSDSIINAVDKVISGEYDSAFSAEEYKGYFWYQGKPVNYDMKNVVTTQNVEPLYQENGGFFIFKKEVFTELHQRIGENPYLHVTDKFESIDVDDREDFEFAEIAAEYMLKHSIR